jgi:hypothetical protein
MEIDKCTISASMMAFRGCQKRVQRLAGITIALAVMLSVTPLTLSSVTSASASSIVGSYGDGYELGKKAGQSDYESGSGHNSKCPPNDSLSWCTGYKVGYEAGWIAAATLGD